MISAGMPRILWTEDIGSPIGRVTIVTDEKDRLRAVDFEDYEERLHRLLDRHYGRNHVALTRRPSPSRARRALQAYFAGDLSKIDDLATETRGTAFQREVWSVLRHIGSGQTTSYGALARRIGRPKAMRAVGLANGANPIAIVVPCHRVIGANGSLTGYGGGLPRKRWLLEHEGATRSR